MTQAHETGAFIAMKRGVATNFIPDMERAALHLRAAEAVFYIEPLRAITDNTVNGVLMKLAEHRQDDPTRLIAMALLRYGTDYYKGQPVVHEDREVAVIPYIHGGDRITAVFDYGADRSHVLQLDLRSGTYTTTILLNDGLNLAERIGDKDVSGKGWEYRGYPDPRMILGVNTKLQLKTFHDVGEILVTRYDVHSGRPLGPREVHIWVAPGVSPK